MKKVFNWVVWIAAVILGFFFAALQLSYAVTGKVENQITFKVVAVSILIGIATQVGLFLSPWALSWTDWYQKMVFIAMLPSVFWLLSQIYYDGNEFLVDSRSGFSSEVYMHGVETVVMTVFLLIYGIQSVRVSADFLRKPSTGGE